MTVLTGHRLAGLIADRTGSPALGHDAVVVGQVLPFRVPAHVADALVDWSRAPDDPLYRLVMPHRELLAPADFAAVERRLRGGDPDRLRLVVDGLRERLDPHPDGRSGWDGRHPRPGTPLVLPLRTRSCHSRCAACFRGLRQPGDPARGLRLRGPGATAARLARHPEATEVVLADGDPLALPAEALTGYVAPLLALPRVRTLRVGTRTVSFCPQRLLDAPDADDLLRLFARFVASGRRLELTLHVVHPRELHPEPARRALGRLRATGAVLRTRTPLARHVNDDPAVWVRLWREQLALGLLPHRMGVERGRGPRGYFGLPLVRAREIYEAAVREVPEAAETVCGPVMATERGLLAVDGNVSLGDGPALALRALRARDPALTGTVAHARADPTARWWDELVPYGPRDRALIPGEPLTPGDLTDP